MKTISKAIVQIRLVQWEEVFLEWYKSEGENPNWLELAKSRGYNSWAEWRLDGYAKRFGCEKARWGFFEITNPGEVVKDWFGGPFRTWIERHYSGAKTKTFAELAQEPAILGQAAVKAMTVDYPVNSVISALKLPDKRIFVIEGMHRACALAVMNAQGKTTPKLIFAIGKSKLAELPAVGLNADN